MRVVVACMDSQQRFVRQLDRAIDRYGENAGYLFVELALQQRAQDMRELADEHNELATITGGDMAGWRAEQNSDRD